MMTSKVPRDFPVAPLLDVITTRHPERTRGVAALHQTCGTSGTAAAQWLTDGLTAWQADRAATTLGLHPSAIWGDLWAAMAIVDDVVARDHARLERWVRAYVARHRVEHHHRAVTPGPHGPAGRVPSPRARLPVSRPVDAPVPAGTPTPPLNPPRKGPG